MQWSTAFKFATMSQVGKSPFQRKNTHYINSILITALSLFLLGLMGLMLVSFKHEQDRIKEKIKITAFLKDEVKDADVEVLRKKIEADEWVKSTDYISKDDAAAIVKEKYGEDIKDVLGDYNPLPASIEVYLFSEKVNPDSIAVFQKRLEDYKSIKFTKVDELLVSSIDSNFKLIGGVAAALGVLFLIIAVAIIDKTIRLSMYANRFVIRSMQLVGATRDFVTTPYVKRSVMNGIISAVIAAILLFILMGIIQKSYHYWDFDDAKLRSGITLIIVTLLAVGILITWWSTRNAVHKYIKMKLDELY
ncbi:MAG: hypothetical protein H7X71_05995 [Chitinophagales bacterium]|nr:hypothetical protein [Chitinophagales bacterium]